MTTPRRSTAVANVALWIIATMAVIWWLRAASQLLIPIALAVCISYALEPVVAWISRWMPRLAAASLLMLALLALTGWGIYSLRDDATKALEALPEAARRVRQMITSQQASGPASSIKEASAELQAVATGTDPKQGGGQKPQGGQSEKPSPGGQGEKPQGGQAEKPQGGGAAPSGLLQQGIGSVVALAGHLVVIVFLVFFLLAAGNHFGRRLIEISGSAEKRELTAQIVNDINAQIQRFLLVRVVTGAVVAIATWAVLAMLGTPQAIVWGILAGVFNSIPYFGPIIVSGGLLLVGLVQSGDPMQGLKMGGAALAITSVEGWLLTPPLIGKAEQMSALVVFLGLLLWSWIWGAWGTILAVPMMVVIKSVADHVDRLKPIGRLMAP